MKTIIIKNSGMFEVHDDVAKQIAELQERVKELEICCIDKANKLITAGEKISRRNLQIANQNIEIKNLKTELWNTANELAAVRIQAGIKIA